jgi:hypothetical protein
MRNISDTILSLVVLGAILLVSAVITNLFARAMYKNCRKCGNLNAKRRVQCRICGHPF